MTARRSLTESKLFEPKAAKPPRGSSAAITDEAKSKYTVLLRPSDAARWDDLALRARERVGRRVTKSELLRELLARLVDDLALQAEVFDALPRTAPHD